MPPKTRISRQLIAQKAYELVRREGLGALSAKSLSKELGCSTQPLFWWFESMDDIKNAVLDQAYGYFCECLRRDVSGVNPYKAIGINYILFAKEEGHLFKALFMSDSEGKDVLSLIEAMPFVSQALGKESRLEPDKAKAIMRRMWLFAHGIATMTATGTAEFEREETDSMLTSVFKGLLMYYGKSDA